MLGFYSVMTISKISANVVQNMGLGAPAEKPVTVVASEPKRDNKKVLMWALGGLAVAGAAGILIYNARKGKTNGSTTSSVGGSFSFGAFAKKFADESVFAKTIENVKNKVAGVKFSNEQKGCWEMCNDTEQFGCRLVKLEEPDVNGFVSTFEFDSRDVMFQAANHKEGKTLFNIGVEGRKFGFFVDSASGKIEEDFVDDGVCQKFLDDLDLKKLIDDNDYRKNYIQSFKDSVAEMVKKADFNELAEKTGKTVDELKGVQASSEFQDYWRSMAQLNTDILGVDQGLQRFQGLFNVPECLNTHKIFDFIEGKREIHFLEDFLGGNKAFEYQVDKIEDGLGLIPRQKVAEIRDLSVHNERMKIGDGSNGEFFAYERYNEDMSEFVNIRYYNPAELKDANVRVTQITTKDVSLDMEETADGIQRLSVKRGGEEVSDAEKATLMTVLKDESMRATFVKDFVTRGKELLENYLK